ncbi:hypothetical protein THASP1DRAFT_32490 [Thamnocephalis sphaerospora]|uniref:Translation initiation factor 3 N-terminal domain-containing protein n=1 Tax=Thamnocephalis sphaerospora TaxID=78915 RepID=A0A4P9XIW5_9FUNG|nr:hypothetical protein THASP1DRAFT_32490 [Thamnocephalis sphaerospora]|eukprot:RKP05673.1 hypothetical protein THASP1DRAFT_32490 [Thamnocephalis sphaerospora]
MSLAFRALVGASLRPRLAPVSQRLSCLSRPAACAAFHVSTPAALLRGPPRATPAVVPDRLPRDEEIKSEYVTVVDADGKLRSGGPARLRDVLRSFDRDAYFLIQVDTTTDPPVCRLTSKKGLYDQQRQAKERKRMLAASRVQKQLVVGDAAQPHDLAYKVRKARDMLAKGNRLAIIVETRTPPRGERERAEAVKRRLAMLHDLLHQLADVSSVVRKPAGEQNSSNALLQGKAVEANGKQAAAAGVQVD